MMVQNTKIDRILMALYANYRVVVVGIMAVIFWLVAVGIYFDMNPSLSRPFGLPPSFYFDMIAAISVGISAFGVSLLVIKWILKFSNKATKYSVVTIFSGIGMELVVIPALFAGKNSVNTIIAIWHLDKLVPLFWPFGITLIVSGFAALAAKAILSAAVSRMKERRDETDMRRV